MHPQIYTSDLVGKIYADESCNRYARGGLNVYNTSDKNNGV